MAGKLYFTMACARAGKSTFAKTWLAEGNSRAIVNTDKIRIIMSGQRYNTHTEPLVIATEQIILKYFLGEYSEVLYDETNTSENSIRKILSIDPLAQPIYIPATKAQCYERAHASGQSDLVEYGVIDRHFQNLQRLVGKHGFQIVDQLSVEWAVESIRRELTNG